MGNVRASREGWVPHDQPSLGGPCLPGNPPITDRVAWSRGIPMGQEKRAMRKAGIRV